MVQTYFEIGLFHWSTSDIWILSFLYIFVYLLELSMNIMGQIKPDECWHTGNIAELVTK